MRQLGLALLFVALGAAVAVPTAAAEQLHANPLSVSPNDIDQPDVPVSIVFQLYRAGSLPYPTSGKPVAGVNDVEVVIHGDGQRRRFPTEDLGGGRYRTEIVFPRAGGWDVRVSYGGGNYGRGDEIGLGKGAICIAADCVGSQPGDAAPAASSDRPWTTIVVVAAVLLASALLSAARLAGSGAGGRRRRTAPTG